MHEIKNYAVMEKPDKNNDAILLRLPKELKEELQKQANINGRRITAEINTRLRISLGANGPTLQTILAREAFADKTPGIAPSAPTPSTGPDGQAVTLSGIDMAMLRIFHSLPVEKQLALVSLFK
jgi:hypothetical protein